MSDGIASLEDFIDDKRTTEEEEETSSSDDDTSIPATVNTNKIDYDKDYKFCPSCLAKSRQPEHRNYFYECPDDACGVLEFKTGFYEYISFSWDDDWLSSVDWSKLRVDS